MKEQISTAYWHEKLKQLGIIVIIPSYNNGKTLADVIESVRFYAPDILVVNDGSTDETAGILSRESNLHIITHPANQGKRSSFETWTILCQKARISVCNHH